jgi:hypothetical protein
VVDIFGDVYDAIIEVGAFIGVKIPAPIAAIVAVVITVVAAVLELLPDFTEQDEAVKGTSLPPEDRVAPRFAIYYLDESGERQPLPVLREGQTPDITQEFYIRPHGGGQTRTSNVRFYFIAGVLDASNASATELSFQFSPEDPYSRIYENNIGSGTAENGDSYFEIKKHDGYRDEGDKKTALTIKVINSTATADPEHPVYFPRYYVNDQLFTEDDGFVINFTDQPSASELEQVLIPEHTTPIPPNVTYISNPLWKRLQRMLLSLNAMEKAA